MKNYIQEKYWEAHYEVAKIPLTQLRAIIERLGMLCLTRLLRLYLRAGGGDVRL